MVLRARLLWVFALVVFPVGGCNPVTTPTTAPLTMTLTEWDTTSRSIGTVRLEGVQLCETDTANCETTDADGVATLQLPFNREISYTLTKEGYASLLVADVVPESGLQNRLGMRPDRWIADQHTNVMMSPYPMRDTGTIQLQLQPGLAGATLELVGATGEPYYVDRGEWNPDFTTTTGWGWGGFTQVGPGERQVEFGGEIESCVPNWGWPSDDANSIRIPVREGHITLATVQCAVVPFDGSALIRVHDYQGAGKLRPPLEGAGVCETDTTNCVITDAGGLATLELPTNQEVSFTIEKDGYEPLLMVDETDGNFDSPGRALWRDELAMDWYDSVMSAYPPMGVGTVRVRSIPATEGATFNLIGAAGKAFYDEEDRTRASLDLTATTSAGSGGFLEVPPGEFEIELGGTASGCSPRRGWPGDAESRIRFLVRERHLTDLVVSCQ